MFRTVPIKIAICNHRRSSLYVSPYPRSNHQTIRAKRTCTRCPKTTPVTHSPPGLPRKPNRPLVPGLPGAVSLTPDRPPARLPALAPVDPDPVDPVAFGRIPMDQSSCSSNTSPVLPDDPVVVVDDPVRSCSTSSGSKKLGAGISLKKNQGRIGYRKPTSRPVRIEV
jgi:hypothetical protein